MVQVFEGLMLILFGASWPPQILKTIKVKNPQGKSFLFLFLVMLGYVCGIISKFVGGTWNTDWVIWLYVLDLAMVLIDTILSLYYQAQQNKLRSTQK